MSANDEMQNTKGGLMLYYKRKITDNLQKLNKTDIQFLIQLNTIIEKHIKNRGC